MQNNHHPAKPSHSDAHNKITSGRKPHKKSQLGALTHRNPSNKSRGLRSGNQSQKQNRFAQTKNKKLPQRQREKKNYNQNQGALNREQFYCQLFLAFKQALHTKDKCRQGKQRQNKNKESKEVNTRGDQVQIETRGETQVEMGQL